MSVVPQVVGPSGMTYSRNANAERTINWFVESPDGVARAGTRKANSSHAPA